MVDSKTILLISVIGIGGFAIYQMQSHKAVSKKSLPKPHRVNYTQPPPDPFHQNEQARRKMEQQQRKIERLQVQTPFKGLIKSSHFL